MSAPGWRPPSPSPTCPPTAVPCSTWRVLDQQIQSGRGEPASLRVTYIQPPWLTNLLGVDQAVESQMYEVVQRCGLY